jgi:hypothetical protein
MVSSMTMTSLLWIGGSGTSKYLPVFGSQPTNYQQQGNSQFFQDWTGWRLDERVIDWVPVDYGLMQTGDVLIGRRFVGLDTQLLMLSGGMATHTSIIIRDADNTAWVVSAQNDHFFSNKGRGIQRTQLNEWLDEAKNAGYDLSWLPLDPELRNTTTHVWNEANMEKWYESVKDAPYNLVKDYMSMIDTTDATYPAPFNLETVPILMRTFEHWSPYEGFREELQESLNLRFANLTGISDE